LAKQLGLDVSDEESEEIKRLQDLLMKIYDAGLKDGAADGSKKKEEKSVEEGVKAKLVENGISADQVDQARTKEFADKIAAKIKEQFNVKVEITNDNGFTSLKVNNGYLAPEDTGSNPHVISVKNLSSAIEPFYSDFRKKGWTFTQPAGGKFSIGVPKETGEVKESLVAEACRFKEAEARLAELNKKDLKKMSPEELNTHKKLVDRLKDDVKKLKKEAV